MIHEHDAVIRNYLTLTCVSRPLPAQPAGTCHFSHRQPDSRRQPETARLGIRCSGRHMHPAALRVLETTWRVWREPLA